MMQSSTLTHRMDATTDARRVGRLNSETISIVCIFGLSLLLILASRFVSPALGSWSQAYTILTLASFLIVVAFGQGMVILTGGLDLSVASVITLGGVLSTTWNGDANTVILIPLVLLVCAAVGAVNGLGVTLLRIPPFIMTMAVGIVVTSVALGFTNGTPRGAAPAALTELMKAEWLGMPAILLFVALFSIGAWVLQSRTTFGRRLYAVGANPVAAFIAGVGVRGPMILAYMISGAAAGFTGMMLVGYANGATLRMGDSYLLPSIAAVVIGGSSILGGRGSFIGTVGGAILITTLGTVIAALGIEQGWRTVIEGSIILAALLFLRDGVFSNLRKRLGR